MSFSDLMKKPLPSKTVEDAVNSEDVKVESAEVVESVEEEVDSMVASLATESGEEKEFDDAIKEMDSSLTKEDSDEEEAADDKEYDKDEEDLDDIDLSDLSDEELDEMEAELRDSDLDDVVGDIEPVELTADEEREADDLMSLAGTTELLRSELSADEREKFFESATETQIAVFEGLLLESDVSNASSNDEVVTEAKLYNKTTVRFSKEDRKAQLYAVALNVSARAHNDPDFVKLQRVQKVRRILKRRIQKKYHSEALRRMKVYFNRLKSSKSSVLAAIGKKLAGSDKTKD